MYEFLHSAVAFIVAIGILVSFHEFGHYWVARRLGVKVLRFSVGFGKPLWQRKAKDGVEYVLASIPLGGYVKLLDEREGPVPEAELPRAFNRQPAWARILIFAAGPAFNFLLAIGLYWIMYMAGVQGLKPVIGEPAPKSAAAAAGLHAGDRIVAVNGRPIPTWEVLRYDLIYRALRGGDLQLGVEHAGAAPRAVRVDMARVRVDPEVLLDDLGLAPLQPKLPPVLGEIQANSAAAQAGFQAGDRILACAGQPVDTFQAFRECVSARPGQVVAIAFERAGNQRSEQVLLTADKQGGATIGRFGAGPQIVADGERMWQDSWVVAQYGPIAALSQALHHTWDMTALVVVIVEKMLVGRLSVKNISGPISTAQVAGYAASAGLQVFLGFLAVISINLGIVNLLPIPVLDGGQIVNCLIESIKGSPLSERTQSLVQQLGFGLVILIMGFAFYNDIVRLFG